MPGEDEAVRELLELVENHAVRFGAEDTEGCRRAVLEYVATSALRRDAGCSEVAVLLALVAGARGLVEQARRVEVVAAGSLREQGVSLRQLAEHAGISEQAAAARYESARRDSVTGG